MSGHDEPDPERQDLQDRYGAISERMNRVEQALLNGQIAPDAFVWVYRDYIETREAIVKDMVRHELRPREPERAAERPERLQVQERPATPTRDDQLPSPTEPRRVDLSGPLSLNDIRAAVRQSQQEASRQQDADERQRQDRAQQHEHDPDDWRRR